jgi:OmcA/MtrC family decaheme c-type cytochrome
MMIKIFKEVFMLTRSLKFFLFTLMLVAALMMFGCGDDGSPGPPGPAGEKGDPGDPSPGIEAAAVEPETCVICHGSVDQTEHQSIYNMYTDASTLALTINGVTSQAGTDPGTFDATVTFTITQNGAPYTDVDGLPSLDQKRFYAVAYDPATATFDNSVSFGGIPGPDNDGDGRPDFTTNFVATGNLGEYEAYAIGADYDPAAFTDGQLYGYVTKGELDVEEFHGSHVDLFNDVANATLLIGAGAADTYTSPANVAGCKKCHGDPYLKHGYRAAQVTGSLGDFSACKACHYDTRNGGHEDWQILVADPDRFAEIHEGDSVTDEEETTYAYTANVMNDVHMSHSMEFGYPQNIANCATCHDGKLETDVLIDENFTLETCKSCHPVETNDYEAAGEDNPIHGEAAPSLRSLWNAPGAFSHSNVDLETQECNVCHSVGGQIGPLFSKLMPGYDPLIYADNEGTKYSEIFHAKIDSAEYADNILTVSFHFEEDAVVVNPTAFSVTDINPYLMVGLYGYDTKDFIIDGHARTSDTNGDGVISRQSGDASDLEATIISETSDNPRFTIDSAPGDGTYVVKVDLSKWADQIDGVQIKKAEIAVRPQLENPALNDGTGDLVALNAPSRTFDLTTNAFVDDFFGNDIVDVQGCNKCHDALATTFHSADRGGNVTVCRLCHVSSNPGSHLEMQSRAIDSYAHAIHSFQGFDIGDVDFADPVQAVAWEIETEHFFPNFTAKNCEACHKAGAYMVPDEFYSLSAVLSSSDYPLENKVRNIGDVPSYVTGPGYRSCGGCHRAEFIKEDEAGELLALNSHAKDMGYLVEDGDWNTIVDAIQAFFH